MNKIASSSISKNSIINTIKKIGILFISGSSDMEILYLK
jgi:hypothetical protein